MVSVLEAPKIRISALLFAGTLTAVADWAAHSTVNSASAIEMVKLLRRDCISDSPLQTKNCTYGSKRCSFSSRLGIPLRGEPLSTTFQSIPPVFTYYVVTRLTRVAFPCGWLPVASRRWCGYSCVRPATNESSSSSSNPNSSATASIFVKILRRPAYPGRPGAGRRRRCVRCSDPILPADARCPAASWTCWC